MLLPRYSHYASYVMYCSVGKKAAKKSSMACGKIKEQVLIFSFVADENLPLLFKLIVEM